MIMRIALILLSLLASFGTAQAHRPYFTERQPIDLPDGQRGELRLLHGDGIFFADPVYAVIVNGEGRLVARSHKADQLTLKCNPDIGCRAFDLRRGLVLELDPATFRDGPLIRNADGSDTDRWTWLDERNSGSSWGFSVRPMSRGEKSKVSSHSFRRVGECWLFPAFLAH